MSKVGSSAVCVLLASLASACTQPSGPNPIPPPVPSLTPPAPVPPTPPASPAARLQMSGRVLDEDGTPIAGAGVMVWYATTPSAVAIAYVAPVGGTPAERTPVRIRGSGFQSGAVVTLDGVATPATVVNSSTIDTTAPPHPPGDIDIVVINPDGGTSRLEKAFAYVQDLLVGGEIAISLGDSITAMLGPDDELCTIESVSCRRLTVRASAGDMAEVEVVPLGREQLIGLFDVEPAVAKSFPRKLAVRGGQQVWVIGNYSVFSLTARSQK